MNVAEMVAKHKLSTEHTGGGCMAYEYVFPDGSYILVTNEANLPQDGERIQVGYVDKNCNGESYACLASADIASVYIGAIIGDGSKPNLGAASAYLHGVDGWHESAECKDKCFGWNFDTCQCEYGVDGQCWNSPVKPAAFCEDCMSGPNGEDPPCNGLHDEPVSDEERSNGPIRR